MGVAGARAGAGCGAAELVGGPAAGERVRSEHARRPGHPGELSVFPVLFTVGGAWVSSYGALGALGFTLAVIISVRQARRSGIPAARIIDLGFWILVAGLIGGRIVFAITNAEDFVDVCRDAPGLGACTKVLQVWQGGLAWYGSLIGAVLFMVWWLKRQKLAVLPVMDVIAPGAALGHALGRIGCFAAGCCYGRVAEPGTPGALTARFGRGSLALLEGRQAGWATLWEDLTPRLYAVQLGEAALELCMGVVLLLVLPRKRFHGQVVATWLMGYALGRAVLEHFRGDLSRGRLVGVSTSQWLALAMAGVGALLWVRAREAGRGPAPAPQP